MSEFKLDPIVTTDSFQRQKSIIKGSSTGLLPIGRVHRLNTLEEYKEELPTTEKVYSQTDRKLLIIIQNMISSFSTHLINLSSTTETTPTSDTHGNVGMIDLVVNCVLLDFGVRFAKMQKSLKNAYIYSPFNILEVIQSVSDLYLQDVKQLSVSTLQQFKLLNYDQASTGDKVATGGHHGASHIMLALSKFRMELKSRFDTQAYLDKVLKQRRTPTNHDDTILNNGVESLKQALDDVKPLSDTIGQQLGSYASNSNNEQGGAEVELEEKEAPVFKRYMNAYPDLQMDDQLLADLVEGVDERSESLKAKDSPIDYAFYKSAKLRLKDQTITHETAEPITIALDPSLEESLYSSVLDFHRYEEYDSDIKNAQEQNEFMDKLFATLPRTYEEYTDDYGIDDGVPAAPLSHFCLISRPSHLGKGSGSVQNNQNYTFQQRNTVSNIPSGSSSKRLPVIAGSDGSYSVMAALKEYLFQNPSDFLHELVPGFDIDKDQKIYTDRQSKKTQQEYIDDLVGTDYKSGYWNMKSMAELRLQEESRKTHAESEAKSTFAVVSSKEQAINDKLKSLRETSSAVQHDLIDLQHRLEAIWTKFEIPLGHRIKMAIKYGNVKYMDRMQQSLDLWEAVADGIEKREMLLTEIREFERKIGEASASYSPSFIQNMQARYIEEIHSIGDTLSSKIINLYVRFGDVVIYKGVEYREKMHTDVAETIYGIRRDKI